MENGLRISVVMAVYEKDNAKHFAHAVNSLLNQTYLPSEIVIVVDGPVGPKTCQELDSFSVNPLIRILRLSENKGLANALNIGIRTARFPLIARMDSDDISYLNRFELQVEYLKRHPEVDVIGGNILEFEGEEVEIKSERRVPEWDWEIKKKGRLVAPVNHPTVMFRRKVFQKIDGYSETIFPEDYYLWLKMFKEGFIFYNIQQPLLLMRKDTGLMHRRRGRRYLKRELHFLNTSYKEGLLPLNYYILNVGIRSFFRLMPVWILQKFYAIFLRENIEQPTKEIEWMTSQPEVITQGISA